MYANPILEHLRIKGQQLDFEIATATGIPLPKVRKTISDLSARGDISTCSMTQFTNGKPVNGTLCRIAGTIPPKAPGRKPGKQQPG